MKFKKQIFLVIFSVFQIAFAQVSSDDNGELLNLSVDLITAVKNQQNTDQLVEKLNSIDIKQLEEEINTDEKKIVFWVNIYNAFVQIDFAKDTARFIQDTWFYNERRIQFKDTVLALNNVKHWILRKSKVPWGKGFVNKARTRDWEKRNRVENPDFRIHFVLNDGTAQAPQIRILKLDELEKTLTEATKEFMEAHSKYEAKKKRVFLSEAVVKNHKRDFGNKTQMREWLKSLKIVPEDAPKKFYIFYKKEKRKMKLMNFAK